MCHLAVQENDPEESHAEPVSRPAKPRRFATSTASKSASDATGNYEGLAKPVRSFDEALASYDDPMESMFDVTDGLTGNRASENRQRSPQPQAQPQQPTAPDPETVRLNEQAAMLKRVRRQANEGRVIVSQAALLQWLSKAS